MDGDTFSRDLSIAFVLLVRSLLWVSFLARVDHEQHKKNIVSNGNVPIYDGINMWA